MANTVTLTMSASSAFDPAEGDAMRRLRDHLVAGPDGIPLPAFNTHKDCVLDILRKCGNPQAEVRRKTSLVVGYVQSGKTISITALACAARDNGYKLIVVLAGTTENLVQQSRNRFDDDLRPTGYWWIRDSLKGGCGKADLAKFWGIIQAYRAGKTPTEYANTAFITVMKNHAHLRRVASLLQKAAIKDIPTLIIDDEADQASLNVAPGSGVSTTYRWIEELRTVAKNHAYVQYTATPQAPLLISIVDALSPDSVTLLDPGAAYTGGQTFFPSSSPKSAYVDVIPNSDLQTSGGLAVEPPPSLLRALRIFLLGVAVAFENGDAKKPKKYRSMLVHPSSRKNDHVEYFGWVQAAKSRYTAELEMIARSAEPTDIEEEFQPEYESLKLTQPGLAPLAKLLKVLSWAISHIDVATINSDNAAEVDWDNRYAHILIGGNKLSRGYTVEGLTVTYLSRGIGQGNVDTIQQRARFFGYKSSYLGLCRVFLDNASLQAYRAYVEHEEAMRKHLRAFEHEPLNNWKRVLYLAPGLRPTREAVISDALFSVLVGRNGWFKMQAPHLSLEATKRNREIVNTLIAAKTFDVFDRDNRRAPKHRHRVCYMPLAVALKELLVEFRSVDLTDNGGLFPITCVLADVAQDTPSTSCAVVLMDNLASRDRGVRGAELSTINIHAGEAGSEHGYLGDAEMRAEVPTIQIHNVNVKTPSGAISDVLALAIWVPSSLRSQNTIVEPGNVAS